MGRITTIVSQEIRDRLYDEGAAIPYRGLSVLDSSAWEVHGPNQEIVRTDYFLTIITDKVPHTSEYGEGHHDTIIDGEEIRFKKDSDV